MFQLTRITAQSGTKLWLRAVDSTIEIKINPHCIVESHKHPSGVEPLRKGLVRTLVKSTILLLFIDFFFCLMYYVNIIFQGIAKLSILGPCNQSVHNSLNPLFCIPIA